MADSITQRTAELEQGLNEFQTEMNRRAVAPPEPLTPPIDPNAPAPTVLQSTFEPADEAPEPAGPPTWDQVKSEPGFAEASPESKLVAFSRWHDDTYNVLTQHPDWAASKDAFNKSAADEEKVLSAAAGGLTPDQARVKIATDKVNTLPHGQPTRDALAAMGPDVVKAYYDHVGSPDTSNDDWNFGQGMGTDIAKAALSTIDQKLIGAAKGLVRFVAPKIEMPKNAKPGDIGYDLVKNTNEKLEGLNNFMNTWREETPKGVGVAEGTTGTAIGEFTGGLAPYVAALPAAVLLHMGERYGDTYDSSKGNKATAAASAAWAGATDIMFMKLGEVGATVGSSLESPVARWAASMTAGTGINISVGQLIKAGEAALDAPAGKRYEKFKSALEDLKPSDAGVATAFAYLATKHAASARAKANLETKADAAGQANAPKVKEVLDAAAEPLAEQAGEQVAQAKVVEPAKAAEPAEKMQPPPGGENKIVITREPDEAPKVEIPDDVTLEHLHETKAEVAQNYAPDSADANALNKQLDEAIAAKEKEFAPAGATPTDERRAAVEKQVQGEAFTREEINAAGGIEQAIANRVEERLVEPPKPAAAAPAADVSSPEDVQDFAEIKSPHKVGIEAGLKLKQEDAPSVQTQLDQANAKLKSAGEDYMASKSPESARAWQAAQGESTYFAGKLEGIKREGPNYDAYREEQGTPPEPAAAPPGKPEGWDEMSKEEKSAWNKAEFAKQKEAGGVNKPPAEHPANWNDMTRAERSAWNKEQNKERIAGASAERKAAREASGEGVSDEQKQQITADTVKRGIVPTLDKMQEDHPNMDITTAADLRKKLSAELAKQYPPEPVPQGSKVETVEHDYTKEKLPTITTKDADGVTRSRPQFTNNPDTIAQMRDRNMFSNERGDRMYIPDELVDGDQVNPSLLKDALYDKETRQYYVNADHIETSIGLVNAPHDVAVANQKAVRSVKEGARDQLRSYTQLREERDIRGKSQGQFATENIERASEKQALRDWQNEHNIDEDAIHENEDMEQRRQDDEDVAAGHITQIAPESASPGDANAKFRELVWRQRDEAELDEMGLMPKKGEPKAKNPVAKAIEALLKDPKVDEWRKELLRLVKKSGYDTSGINVEIHSDPTPKEPWAGRFDHRTNTMLFNVGVGPHVDGLRNTFMHEFFHAILDGKLAEGYSPRNPIEAAAHKALTKLHNEVSTAIYKQTYGKTPTAAELAKFQDAQYNPKSKGWKGRDFYGLHNVREFVMESLTNPRFRQILNDMAHEGIASRFRGIINTIKEHAARLFAGIEVKATSKMDVALHHMFELIEEGDTEASRLYEGWRKREAEMKGEVGRQAELAKAGVRKDLMEGKRPDLEKVQDRQNLTRAQRSEINKIAYKVAKEMAAKDPSVDLMEEWARQRDYRLERFRESRTFTAEGRVKMADADQRATERAKEMFARREETGMTEEELQNEISGGQPTDEEGAAPFKRPEITLLDKVQGDGWVTPDGRFMPIEERYHPGLENAGVNPLIFGGHGSHGSAAWEHIQQDPVLKSEFEQAAKDKGYGSITEMSEGDVKDFLEARGYLRVLHDGRATYFTGNPETNQKGVDLLHTHAIDNARVLAHDRELTQGGLKELYRPPNMLPETPASPIAEPPEPAATAPAEEGEEPLAKIKYKQSAKGRRNISIEGVPNKAQVEATFKMIDSDAGASDATKTALKDQLALAAQAQEPVLAERVQFKIPGTKRVITPKDTGVEAVVHGFDSAQNIPRIYADQQSARIAMDYGSAKTPTKEVSQDRRAATFIVDEGKDLHRLEVARDQIDNAPINKSTNKIIQSRMQEIKDAINHAIDNFDRLKGKGAHDKAMKATVDREHTWGIETPELKDYVTRQLDSPDFGDSDVIGVSNGKGGTRYFTKARSFETLADAISNGFLPKTLDIVDLDHIRMEASERLIQQKMLALQLQSVNAPDGQPIIGTTKTRQTLYKGEQQVVPEDYRMVSTHGGPGLIVHKDYAPLFEKLYGARGGNVLSDYAGWAKRNTLVLDTFHVGRIMLKTGFYSKGAGRFGYQKGLSILEYAKEDLNKALEVGDLTKDEHAYAMKHYEDAQALIRNGLNVARVADNLNAELTKALPFLKNFNPWVFGKLSRGAMLQTALANLERNQSRFGGELSRDEVLRRTAKEMNEVFGNLQAQSVFKDPKMQNLMRSLLLAPQWTESQLKSELRGYGQLLKAPIDLLQGKARLGVVVQGQLTAALGMFAAMQVASLIMNGKTTFQNKKGDWLNLHIPGGRNGFEFNPMEIAGEYAFFVQRYHSQHMQPFDIASRLAFNKLNPVPHGVLNAILNRDYAGHRYASSGDRYRALVESAVPLMPAMGMAVERDPRSMTGLRFARPPGGSPITNPTNFASYGPIEKNVLQSFGFKINASQTPRAEVFALAQPFRDDKSYGDNSPPVYRELRTALDIRNDNAVRSEIKLLASRGATEAQIKGAVGVSHGGITPEKFTGQGAHAAAREKLFIHSLTPEQRKIYNEAQADHKSNARVLLSTLSKMKSESTELASQLHKNAQNPKAKDYE